EVIMGFRPYFKASEIKIIPNPALGGGTNAFPDTLTLSSATQTILVVAQAYDGNDQTGRTLVNNPVAYVAVLDPESGAPRIFESGDGQINIDLNDPNRPTEGLHVVEVTANDYLAIQQQRPPDGRTTKVRIPFFFGHR